MKIEYANISQLDDIMSIYSTAQDFMAKVGNPNQWKKVYPSRQIIKQDILNANLYVCLENNTICGVFCFTIANDSTYSYIIGKWLNEDKYGVIHRLASSQTSKGVAKACLEFCFDKIKNIRVDTHKDNIVMQNLFAKFGFTYCGIIFLADGQERLAYQKQQ